MFITNLLIAKCVCVCVFFFFFFFWGGGGGPYLMIGPSIWYDLASRQVFWANLHKIFLGKLICIFMVSVRAAYCHR